HDARADFELPQHLAAARVGCLEPAVERAVEDYAPRRHDAAAPHRVLLLDSPDFVTARGVPGDELTAVAARADVVRRRRADVRRRRYPRHRRRFEVHAEIVGRGIEEPRAWRVRSRRRGTLATFEARADAVHVAARD